MPKLVDHDAQRAALLDGAFEIMARCGVDAVGMREIAEELGISTGMLYHYFPSKEALFEQIFRRQCRRDLAAAGSKASGPLAVRLSTLQEYVLRKREHFTNQALVTSDVLRKHPRGSIHLLLKDLAANYRKGLATFLEVPLEVAELVSSAVDGLVLHHLADPKRVDLEAELRLLGEMIMAHQASKARGRRRRERVQSSSRRTRRYGARGKTL